MSTSIGPSKRRLPIGPEPIPHDLREIAATHGMDAIAARINELHAAGNHVAADTIERELRRSGMSAEIINPDHIDSMPRQLTTELHPRAAGSCGRADRR